MIDLLILTCIYLTCICYNPSVILTQVCMVRNWVDPSVIHVIFVAQVGSAVLADPSVYLKRTNFRVYLFSRAKKNSISRILIFANDKLFENFACINFCESPNKCKKFGEYNFSRIDKK